MQNQAYDYLQGGYGTKAGAAKNGWLEFLRNFAAAHGLKTGQVLHSDLKEQALNEYHASQGRAVRPPIKKRPRPRTQYVHQGVRLPAPRPYPGRPYRKKARAATRIPVAAAPPPARERVILQAPEAYLQEQLPQATRKRTRLPSPPPRAYEEPPLREYKEEKEGKRGESKRAASPARFIQQQEAVSEEGPQLAFPEEEKPEVYPLPPIPEQLAVPELELPQVAESAAVARGTRRGREAEAASRSKRHHLQLTPALIQEFYDTLGPTSRRNYNLLSNAAKAAGGLQGLGELEGALVSQWVQAGSPRRLNLEDLISELPSALREPIQQALRGSGMRLPTGNPEHRPRPSGQRLLEQWHESDG